jgi:hypothetical protein
MPVHADGTPVGATPIKFEVVPATLRVLVGVADVDAASAWDPEPVTKLETPWVGSA